MSEMQMLVYILFLSTVSGVNILLWLSFMKYQQEQERKARAWRKMAPQYPYQQN